MLRRLDIVACALYFIVNSPPSTANPAVVLTDFDKNQYAQVNVQLLELRIKQALLAVGEQGEVWFVEGYAKQDSPLNLPHQDERFHHVTVHSANKQYPWIRDEIAGWSKRNGSFVLMEGKTEPAWIEVLLRKMGQEPLRTTGISVPWGNALNNHAGTCLVSKSDLDASEEKNISVVYRNSLDCRTTIVVPRFITIPHNNNHLDLYMQFISENVLAFSKVPDDCDENDFYIKNLRSDLQNLEHFIAKELPKMTIVHLPLAGCPISIDNLEEKSTPKLEILSYTNLISFHDSILIPEYIGLAASESQHTFEETKKTVESSLERLGLRKSVLSFPVPRVQAAMGGSLRCLTWDSH